MGKGRRKINSDGDEWKQNQTENRWERRADPNGGVLRGCDKCLAVLAELAAEDRVGVSQQSG